MSLLTQSSLVLIPSGYKEDIVYSVIPNDATGDLSFTRASNGTRINFDGLVEVCPWNLLSYSEDLSNAVWALSSATISTNATTAPNDTLTADKFIATATNAVHFFQQSAVSSSYVFSIYAKAGEENVFSMWIANTSKRAEFNLTTGTIPLSTVANSSIVNVGNGWYRCSVYDSSPTTTYRIYGRTGSSYLVNGVDGMFFWGAQLNDGSTAKPYFPTTDRLNVPRLTYQNGGGGCPSLLLEPQRTNLALYSEQYDNAAWTKQSGTSVTANQTISPDGTLNADLVVGNGSSGILQSGLIVSTTTNNTKSIYLKGVSGGEVVILKDPNVTIGNTICTLTTSWQRFTLSETQILGLAGIWVANIPSGGIYVWGAQLEVGSYATSYIPTVASSATRIADDCTKSGIGALIGGTSGTVFFDIKTNPVLSSANYKQFCYYFDSVNAQSYLYLDGANKITTNSNWGSLFYNTALQPNTRYKVALVYALNDFALYLNGVSVATTLSGTPKNNERISIGQLAGNENAEFVFNQYTHFPTRLTNAQLATLTTI